MADFILLLIIGSLWIWGVFAVFDEGNLLWFIREELEKTQSWPFKPIFSCPYCMASLHGFVISTSYCVRYDHDFILIIPYIVCLCGLNFIIKEYLYP